MPGFTFRPPPGADEGRKVKVQWSAETEKHATKVNAGNRKWEVLLPLPKKALARAGAFFIQSEGLVCRQSKFKLLSVLTDGFPS